MTAFHWIISFCSVQYRSGAKSYNRSMLNRWSMRAGKDTGKIYLSQVEIDLWPYSVKIMNENQNIKYGMLF